MKHAKKQYQIVRNRTNLKELIKMDILTTEQADRIAAMMRHGASLNDALYATKELTMDTEHYKIKDRYQETDCEYCGYPLYTGDTAYQAESTVISGIYCTLSCARKDHDRSAPVIQHMKQYQDLA